MDICNRDGRNYFFFTFTNFSLWVYLRVDISAFVDKTATVIALLLALDRDGRIQRKTSFLFKRLFHHMQIVDNVMMIKNMFRLCQKNILCVSLNRDGCSSTRIFLDVFILLLKAKSERF